MTQDIFTCVLCQRTIIEERNGPSLSIQVERSGDRAHRECHKVYFDRYAAGRDAMIKKNTANAPLYLRSSFEHPAVRRIVAIFMRMTGDRIEIRFNDDGEPVAFIDRGLRDGLRAMLDDLDSREWGRR